MRAIRKAWESITEPRHLKAVYFVVYAVAFVTGIATLVAPPQTIAGALGPPLTVAWSVFLITGGTGGLFTVFPGWWWAERLSIALVLAGLGIYAVVVASLHFTSDGSRATQLGVIALATAPFLVRWTLIRRFSFEPRG